LRFGELLHTALHDFGLLFGVVDPLLVSALGIVAYELEEERNVIGLALGSDALNERMLDVVDGRLIERRVVDEDLDRVGAPIDDTLDGDVREQVGETAGTGVVVAAELISEEEAGERARAASRPNSGSSRIALACGVRTLETTTLNSLIISVVICLISTPRATASDFCRLPRWSMAAAAMMPRSFDSAFMRRSFPSDKPIGQL
jgi:hypothetical protein